jgi:hypothetical protein
MQESNKVPQNISFPIGPKLILFACILLGLLFLMIGNWANVEALHQIGAFLLPAAFFWGGFYVNEGAGVRIALLAVGGYLAAAGLLSGLSALSSIFG